MALPASGTLALTTIATEFGDTAPHSMSEFYRGGGKVPDSAGNSAVAASGALNVGGFYNAANRVALALTIASNTQNYDLFTQVNASPSYAAGTSDVTLTVNSGVVVGSTSTGTYAMSVPSGFSAGDTVTIVNNGTVIGRGGSGGAGAPYLYNATAGGGGGNALYVNRALILTNNGTLSGGGGGGGGGGSGLYSASPKTTATAGGGGGGGGAGNSGGSGGAGGATPTASGSTGGAGSTASGGGGGGGGPPTGGAGGAGGGQGGNGGAGVPAPYRGRGLGGTRGFYAVGNSNITYSATGTRLGQVS